MPGITYTIGADGKPLMEAMDKAQAAVERFKKNVANNELAVRTSKLQVDADRARVQGKELEAKKIENQIALERELARIKSASATESQRDQLAANARAQKTLADKQAEINQAQKLANIQAGNQPGQIMSAGAKRFRMQNISAQLQDAAVQAQMGTSVSTIVGQQAPQLISAMGGTGAMAGAAAGGAIAIAIGVGIAGAIKHADTQFKNMVTFARDAAAEISQIQFTSNDQGDISSGIKKGEESLKTIREEYKRQRSVTGSISDWFIDAFGGDTVQSKENEVFKSGQDAKRKILELQTKSVEISNREIEIAKLRAVGDDRAIELMERKRKLELEIHGIRKMGLVPAVQDKAIEAATAKSDAETQRENNRETLEISKKLADRDAAARTKAAAEFTALEDERKKKIEARFTLEEKLTLSKHRMEEARRAFKKTANGSVEQEQAEVELMRKTKEHEANREEQIARIKGGSVAEGAARRSERDEKRAQAKAERIQLAREREETRARMQREGKSTREIGAALSGIGGGDLLGVGVQGQIAASTKLASDELCGDGGKGKLGMNKIAMQSYEKLDAILKKLNVA